MFHNIYESFKQSLLIHFYVNYLFKLLFPILFLILLVEVNVNFIVRGILSSFNILVVNKQNKF